MTTQDEPNVVPLRRPPIRQGTNVRSDIEHTFSTFVGKIGDWWPLRPYSVGQDEVASVTFEQAVGGRVYETWGDGTEVTWGRVLAWDPPTRFAMTWELLAAVTEVEVAFRSLGPALTRVDVTHSGWERLSEDDLAAATSVTGGYEAGWQTVLAAFASAFDD